MGWDGERRRGKEERGKEEEGKRIHELYCVEIEDCLPKRRTWPLPMSMGTQALLTSQLNRGQRMGIPCEGSMWPLGKVPKQPEAVGTGGSHWAEGVGPGCSIVSVVCSATCTFLLKFTPWARQICSSWEFPGSCL